jgi:hypothetical protein
VHLQSKRSTLYTKVVLKSETATRESCGKIDDVQTVRDVLQSRSGSRQSLNDVGQGDKGILWGPPKLIEPPGEMVLKLQCSSGYIQQPMLVDRRRSSLALSMPFLLL